MDRQDITSLLPHLPLFLYVYVLLGSILFKLDDHPIVAPFVIGSSALALIGIYMLHSVWEIANKEVDMYPALICWSIWLGYGMIFKGVGNHIPEGATLISGVWIIFIVASLYKPGLYDNYNIRVAMVMVYVTLILFIPSEDSIAADSGMVWVITKSTIFYVLYFLSSLEKKLMIQKWMNKKKATKEGLDPKYIVTYGGEKLFYKSVERTLLQSSWVLFVNWYFIIAALIHIAAIITWLNDKTEIYVLFNKKGDNDLAQIEHGHSFNEVSLDDIKIVDVSEYGSDEEYCTQTYSIDV